VSNEIGLRLTCPDFDGARENSAKFGLHAGDIKFNAQNEEGISQDYFLSIFLHTMCNKNTE
jgi:hypothetical protein